MPVVPVQTSVEPSAQYLALYRATLQEAAGGGGVLMSRMIAAARLVLQTSRAESARQLSERESDLCTAYPKALLEAFSNPEMTGEAAALFNLDLQFDQLELMGEDEVMTNGLIARTRQTVTLAAEASLAELNALICRTLGLNTVRPESNPLRPQVYVNALNAVIEQSQVSASTRLDWLGAMGVTLGQELRALYASLSNRLKTQGVVGTGYAVRKTPHGKRVGGATAPDGGNVGVVRAASGPVREKDEALLTLDKLRRLLMGELNPPTAAARVKVFAQQFAREFENGVAPTTEPESDFPATLPAAFEALTEMKQVERVVQNLELRRGLAPAKIVADDASVDAVRQALRRNASGVAQALSLEVVILMVENMAHDPRLLEPVQRLLGKLEPALLRLALVDARFFTNKQHPARALLQEITERSLAYASEQTSGFAEFMQLLEQATAALTSAVIESDEPFAQVLMPLREAWAQAEKPKERDRKDAVEVLRHAEARNLLAETIAREIDASPNTSRVSAVVMDFLCGPWSQVVAQARIADGSGSAVATRYQALISALLWSVHPDLAHKNTAKLTRLVPLLLSTLREGLESIGYPATKTSAFFESLMGLQQMAFRSAKNATEASASAPAVPATRSTLHRVESADPWVAPEEAKTSGLLELPGLAESPDVPVDDLPLGAWVELEVDKQWVRTQLIWASPHGSLFMFASVLGATQSMTRRSRDKLVAAGKLRVVSDRPFVEGALDAVAQIAMKNSVDSTL